jgi:hypothetical protein
MTVKPQPLHNEWGDRNYLSLPEAETEPASWVKDQVTGCISLIRHLSKIRTQDASLQYWGRSLRVLPLMTRKSNGDHCRLLRLQKRILKTTPKAVYIMYLPEEKHEGSKWTRKHLSAKC